MQARLSFLFPLLLVGCGGGSSGDGASTQAIVAQGREIFRHDTFGDEAFWTDQLRMNEPLGTAVSPKTALSVGLKVDADALPAASDGSQHQDCKRCHKSLRYPVFMGVRTERSTSSCEGS